MRCIGQGVASPTIRSALPFRTVSLSWLRSSSAGRTAFRLSATTGIQALPKSDLKAIRDAVVETGKSWPASVSSRKPSARNPAAINGIFADNFDNDNQRDRELPRRLDREWRADALDRRDPRQHQSTGGSGGRWNTSLKMRSCSRSTRRRSRSTVPVICAGTRHR